MIDSKKKLFRWGPIDATMLFLGYPMVSSFSEMKELFGVCYPEAVVIYDKDQAIWICENQKIEDASNEFAEQNIIPDRKRERFYSFWKKSVKALLGIQKEINNFHLEKLDDKNIGKVFLKWSKSYLDFWKIGMSAELVNYGLEGKLKNILKNHTQEERDFNKAFSVLSTPDKMSFYKEEEEDLMAIVLQDKKKQEKKLSKHQKNYFWMLNNYFSAKELNVDYFKKKAKNATKGVARKFLKEAKNYQQKVKDEKKKYIKRLNLNNKKVKVIQLLNEAIIFQDKRKMHNLKADYYLEEFLKEFSKRKVVPVRDLKWLLPKELEKLAEGEDAKQLIAKRKHIAVAVCDDKKIEIKVQNIASKINIDLNEVKIEKSSNIQGTVACIGKEKHFRGIARIILSPKEGNKLKEGEILVTAMTTPDYVVFMKKAGAIITDIGGVTCHAAVVSREFGIPCIVGTKHATKIIKDGDILEIHNLRGVVKIVNSA